MSALCQDQETGLHYNYFRDYDPRIGRYVQSDPIGLAGGLNTYAYADNAPTMYSDPLGLYSWGEFKQGVIDFTGGCSDRSFTDDVVDNFVNVNDTIGYGRMGLSAAFGGAFASRYGGLTALQAVTKGIGFRSAGSAAVTVAGTSAINGVLIGGMFQTGNLVGSTIRTGINRAAGGGTCGCNTK